MFDTTVTIVGNALNAPELRRTNGTNTLVASFRVASTSRRYDKDSGRWVDGPSLRVRVTCWRRLAEGVKHSVVTGDPLVVTGRMYTRDWIGDDGQQRVSYELEAIAVGHDLSRGFADFKRHRPGGSTSVLEDAESDARIAGELSVPAGGSPRRRGDLDELSPSDAPTPTFEPPSTPPAGSYGGFGATDDGTEGTDDEEEDVMNVLRAVGLGAELKGADGTETDETGADGPETGEPDGDGADADGPAVDGPDVPDAGPADGERSVRRRNRTRVPVPA
jgi:single-strand DNA-binding protein